MASNFIAELQFEVSDAATQGAAQIGDTAGAEDQEHDNEDEEYL
jgi:hypothetical protein